MDLKNLDPYYDMRFKPKKAVTNPKSRSPNANAKSFKAITQDNSNKKSMQNGLSCAVAKWVETVAKWRVVIKGKVASSSGVKKKKIHLSLGSPHINANFQKRSRN